MKYQVWYNDIMSIRSLSERFDTYEEAQEALEKAKEEIRTTWATPDTNGAYIHVIHEWWKGGGKK